MSATNSSIRDEIWKLFLNKKVMISLNIEKSFPFFHGLRDKQIISEENFQQCIKEVKSNPKAINEVVYDVLDGINSESALWVIFCEENLKEYPNLKPIFQELQNALQCAEPSSAAETRSNEVHNPGQNNPETSTTNQPLQCAEPSSAAETRSNEVHNPGQNNPETSTTNQRKRKQNKEIQILDFKGNRLHVFCGKIISGVLYKKKLAAGILNKSIKSSDGKWFTPPEFENEGGRASWKNWKRSIRGSIWGPIHSGMRKHTLEKLIKEGVLTDPPHTRRRKNKDSHQCLQKKKTMPCSGRCNQAGTSHPLPRTRFPTPNPQPSQTENPRSSLHQVPLPQLSGSAKADAFSLPELSVQCGAVTGVLYKDRFVAGGPQKKCIRMEERWCTPEEFVGMDDDINFGSWDNDIRANGVSLKELRKNGYLEIHPKDCPCESCKEDTWPENDDQCFVCSDGGDLFCCDSCPRTFHDSCHVPDVPTEKSFKWICTFCKLKSTLDCAKTASYREDQVLLQKMCCKETLRCQFLLLNVWCQHESVLFAEDPTMQIPDYGLFIKKPMWLQHIKEKLQQNQYKTVGGFKRDMGLIFKNFQEFNKGKEIEEEGRKLQDKFEKTFQEVFLIKPPVSAAL